MKKFLQNKIAESGLALPVVVVYSLVVWLLAGLLANGWWLQIGLYGIISFLMIELNNSNALLRIRSRMVSCVFMALVCMPSTLLGEWRGWVVSLAFVMTTLIIFRSYQDKEAVGSAFFAFFFVGLASLANVYVLLFVPLLGVLMATHLHSLGWRTWAASVMGILAPYWLLLPWVLYQYDYTALVSHFQSLVQYDLPFEIASMSVVQLLNVLFILVLTVVSVFHFWANRFDEKIRTRQFYGFFIVMTFACMLFMAFQPRHYDTFLRVSIVYASPLVAHFLTFSHSRLTNAIFFVVVSLCVLLTGINLYASLLGVLFRFISDLWIGLLTF